MCNIPALANACGAAAEYPINVPIEILTDFSQGPIIEYLIKFYGTALPLERDTSLIIETENRAENHRVVPVNFKLLQQHLEEKHPNMKCSRIDIFNQMQSFQALVPGKRYFTYIKPHSESPISRISSYHFRNNSMINITMRYRRTFHQSILVAAATLIDKDSKRISKIIYNNTDLLKGGPPCDPVRLINKHNNYLYKAND